VLDIAADGYEYDQANPTIEVLRPE
jgi:hypothetical protein